MENRKIITTKRQLAWWITHLRKRWDETDNSFWRLSLNWGHWGNLRLDEKLYRELRRYDPIRISHRYKARISPGCADLPEQLEVTVIVK